MSNKIIWQPGGVYQPGYDFNIILNAEFAKKTFNYSLSQKKRTQMLALPRELMGFEHSEPYRFHEDTLFLRQVNIQPGHGKWLSLDDAFGGAAPDFSKPVKYSTHNFDFRTSSFDVITALSLFEIWAEYSKILIN